MGVFNYAEFGVRVCGLLEIGSGSGSGCGHLELDLELNARLRICVFSVNSDSVVSCG